MRRGEPRNTPRARACADYRARHGLSDEDPVHAEFDPASDEWWAFEP